MNSKREKELNFGVGLAKNRLVRIDKGNYVRVDSLEIPKDGLIVELKGFGQLKIFKRVFKNETTHYYGLFLADKKELEETNRKDFRELFAIHWGIEVYHRALKQLCNLNNFFVRKTSAICTHIFCSLRAFCQLELMRIYEIVENWYEVQKNLYIEVARKFITENFPRVIVSNYLATRYADEEWHRLKLHSFSILSMRNSYSCRNICFNSQ